MSPEYCPGTWRNSIIRVSLGHPSVGWRSSPSVAEFERVLKSNVEHLANPGSDPRPPLRPTSSRAEPTVLDGFTAALFADDLGLGS